MISSAPIEHQSRTSKSPLRYPGGKGAFSSYFSEVIALNSQDAQKYYEPFAGGAGVALGLLQSNAVSEAIINDADYHIYCFWTAVLEQNEQFLEELRKVELSILEWKNQKEVYKNPTRYTILQVGFSAFYLNRCNRSGILAGAGPIGGYEQTGEWRLDARFNKDSLAERIVNVGTLKDRITVRNMDAILFLREHLPKGHDRQCVFVYADPPYVSAGHRLYLNLYSVQDHADLARYLLGEADLKWVVTYDDNPLIRSLYDSCQKWIFSIGYSLQTRQDGRELLIAPSNIKLPTKRRFSTTRWSTVRRI